MDDNWSQQVNEKGLIEPKVSVEGTDDGYAAVITLLGDPEDSASEDPVHTMIVTKEIYSYGTFLARLKLDSGPSNECVCFAFWTWDTDTDRVDWDEDGIIDYNEIDYEWITADPYTLYLTSWSDFEDYFTMHRVQRRINLRTGTVTQTTPGEESNFAMQELAPLEDFIPDYDPANQFYVYGYTWTREYLRFFIVLEDREIELWNFTDPDMIPRMLDVKAMCHVWHADFHWMNNNFFDRADFPAEDKSLTVDWVKIYQ